MKFLNFGSCNVDYVYSLDHIVRVGETQASDKLNVFPGGKGLNQSIALARAGVNVCHAGCIGADGELLMDTLRESGVDVSYIQRVDEKNGHAIIQVSREGENSIFLYAGSNAMITEEYVDFVLANFGKGDYLILQNEINNIEYIIEKAHEREMFIILNPSPISENILTLDLSKLSCIILNECEMTDISGCEDVDEGLDVLKCRYPELMVMLTLGKNGCIYQHKDKRIFHPIFETVAVDTTAAGDTFTGYFVAQLSCGKEIKEILKTASCAAAITVSRHGAAPSIPEREEVIKAMSSMKPKNHDRAGELIRSKISAYIDENPASASLNGLAAVLGYSTVYAGNVTKKEMGISFKKLLQEKRLHLAAEIIKNTETPIGDVIKLVGYENESYFRAKFREKYAQNPFEYRAKNRETKNK